MRNPRRTDNRGASLTLVAVSLSALIGVGAIAIDLGMLLKARADAQRAAEAGALAGASVFLDVGLSAFEYLSVGETRAREFAENNTILNAPVAPSEVESLVVDVATQTVRVKVRRAGVGTWFARIFSEDSIPVAAGATAAVTEAGGANCVKPLMFPDLWSDPTQDPNGTGMEDNGEQWTFDPGDPYAPFDPRTGGPETGYGSAARDGVQDISNNTYQGDYGRELTLTPAVGGEPPGPNDFRLWDFESPGPNPPSLAERVTECDPRNVRVGEDDYEQMGTDPANVLDELQDLMNEADPTNANWNQSTGTMEGNGDWRDSPRVIKVALFDPNQLAGMAGGSGVTFNNLGLFLLESVSGTGITGRFLYYVPGTTEESAGGGSLVKRIRLVE